jgi:hypothetical protein
MAGGLHLDVNTNTPVDGMGRKIFYSNSETSNTAHTL